MASNVALWAIRRAAEKNIWVAKLVGRILESQMPANDDYWQAYREWKKMSPVKGVDAARRMSRGDAYARRL
ncbi:MAG: hypothetical protein LAP39_26405 [Acidobacteriia bacterium]|nr:hypothetical protein [Terriglobia bacterium]